MNKNYSKHLDLLRKENDSLLTFLKAKFPMFHNSNFFFRDLQYGLRKFLEKKDMIISYPESEEMTKKLTEYLEQKEILVKISSSTWKLNYPEFVTQVPGDPL